MPNILEPRFNPGALRDLPDPRRFQWKDVGAAVAPFNWEQGFDIELTLEGILKQNGFKLPVKHQGTSGSCGGQETSQYNGVLEAVATKTFEEESAKNVIAQTFIADENGVMLGSRFGDNSNLAVKKGVCREVLCPSYDNGLPPTDTFMNRPQDIDEAAIADAKLSRARSYAYVFPNIDSFAQAAASNYGLGMLVRGANNGTWLSAFPKPSAMPEWGHFLYIGKAMLVNGKKFIKALNSWGPNVGEDGWQWFGEDWFGPNSIDSGRTMLFDDSIPLPPKYKFTRDLYLGKSGVDVRFLQSFLNNHGCPVATSGPGSIGQETSHFGEFTKQAVMKFQKDHGIKPTLGYFGPITRARVNAMP